MRYISNPPNPWLSTQIEWIGEPPPAKLEVFEETATRSIITHNDSPDIPFDYSVNCYRGCPHGCSYCFSRPTHEYLGFGAGTDFERKIVAKINAPGLLHSEFMRRRWKGDRLIFSFTSDPYVPLEATYQLTRQCLEICLGFRNPVGIITKSALIQRDVALIAELARTADANVFFSIPFTDVASARALEPYAPYPEARFRAMRVLAEAGVEVGVSVSPIIPGLNESQIPAVLERARECGATSAFFTLLRLPGNVAPYFQQRLAETMPDRAPKILKRMREMKEGKLNASEFGARMRGTGNYWEMIQQMFRLHCRRLGFNQSSRAERYDMPQWQQTTFRRPSPQMSLFD